MAEIVYTVSHCPRQNCRGNSVAPILVRLLPTTTPATMILDKIADGRKSYGERCKSPLQTFISSTPD